MSIVEVITQRDKLKNGFSALYQTKCFIKLVIKVVWLIQKIDVPVRKLLLVAIDKRRNSDIIKAALNIGEGD